jgi:uncharacterized membrane protein YjjP (DUF1212 family)
MKGVEADKKRSQSSSLRMWSMTPMQAAGVCAATPPSDPEMRCILVLASALLSYGLPAHRVEECVLRIARALKREVSVFGLPTAAIITAHEAHPTGMFIARAEPGTIDLSRLDALHHLVAQVERGELDAEGAERRVDAILTAARRYPRALDLPAVALVAFGGALMLGTSPSDALWAAGLGLWVAVMLWLSASGNAFSRVMPVLCTVLTTFVSCQLARAGLVAHPLVIAFAALFVLLPGLTLTLAMTELATGHIVSGAARCMLAATVFLQLGFGVLLGLRLGQLDQGALSSIEPASLADASLGALMLAVGFSALFVIRMRDAVLTLLISALAFFTCRGFGVLLGVEIGVLLAATAVGLCSNAFARYRDRPSSTLTLPGVTMLVPGSLGLLAVSAAALHEPSRALDVGFQMLMIVIALSTGILISTAALPPQSTM